MGVVVQSYLIQHGTTDLKTLYAGTTTTNFTNQVQILKRNEFNMPKQMST